ncbi:hypothetical protein ACFYT4_31760 [Streptomyces sp. NPDC004609]|uniref:hypothetical protein n=1 Tax=Streptomyces sp. NPDC004609 TaxID=3364704 RepID=UPI00367F7387
MTFDVDNYHPELEHLDPRVPTESYALADAVDDDEGGDARCRTVSVAARCLSSRPPR